MLTWSCNKVLAVQRGGLIRIVWLDPEEIEDLQERQELIDDQVPTALPQRCNNPCSYTRLVRGNSHSLSTTVTGPWSRCCYSTVSLPGPEAGSSPVSGSAGANEALPIFLDKLVSELPL